MSKHAPDFTFFALLHRRLQYLGSLVVHRPAGIEVVHGAIEVLKANNDSPTSTTPRKVSISTSAATVVMEQENR